MKVACQNHTQPILRFFSAHWIQEQVIPRNILYVVGRQVSPHATQQLPYMMIHSGRRQFTRKERKSSLHFIAMKLYWRNGCIAPYILNHDCFSPQGKTPRHPMKRELVGHKTWSRLTLLAS